MIAAAIATALLLGAAPGTPEAEADALVAEGAKLGGEGRWDEAIALFEQADQKFPRAIHACNIGLVHARAGRPEKALVQLAACQARATEQLPAWVAKRLAEARDAVAKGSYAAVEIVSATPGVRVSVRHYGATTFAPPVTLWLPLGEHHLTASARGYLTRDEDFTLASKAALRHSVDLEPEPVVEPPKEDPPKEIPPKEDPPKGPGGGIEIDKTHTVPLKPPEETSLAPAWITLVTGGVGIATGAVFYGLALGEKSTAEGFEETDPKFASHKATFRDERDLAYGFLIGGAAVAAVGAVLFVVLDDEPVAVAPSIGGFVARARF